MVVRYHQWPVRVLRLVKPAMGDFMTWVRSTHLKRVPNNRRYLFGYVQVCGCGQYARSIDFITRCVWCTSCGTSHYCFMFPGEYRLRPGEIIGWYD